MTYPLGFQNLVGIVAIFGVALAYFIFIKQSLNKKRQIIQTIRSALDVTGVWASSSNQGYNRPFTEEEKLEHIHPFKIIYKVNDAALNAIIHNEEMLNFPTLSSKVNEYNQNLIRIRDIESYREELTTNNFPLSQELEQEIVTYKSNNSVVNMSQFVSVLAIKPNGQLLIQLSSTLLQLEETLHFSVIGSIGSNGLRDQHEHIAQIIKEKKMEIENPGFEIILMSILTFPLISIINLNLFDNAFNIYYQVISSIIVTLFLDGYFIKHFLLKDK